MTNDLSFYDLSFKTANAEILLFFYLPVLFIRQIYSWGKKSPQMDVKHADCIDGFDEKIFYNSLILNIKKFNKKMYKFYPINCNYRLIVASQLKF